MASPLHSQSMRDSAEHHQLLQNTDAATKGIYNLSVKPARTNTPAPHAGPRRSNTIHEVCFLLATDSGRLARDVSDLAAQNRIEKVRTQGAFTAWLWRPTQAPPASPDKPTAATSTMTCSTELTPVAVGVGEDWSHLNKRGERARKMKVERESYGRL